VLPWSLYIFRVYHLLCNTVMKQGMIQYELSAVAHTGADPVLALGGAHAMHVVPFSTFCLAS
jgi:hypothetical protein